MIFQSIKAGDGVRTESLKALFWLINSGLTDVALTEEQSAVIKKNIDKIYKLSSMHSILPMVSEVLFKNKVFGSEDLEAVRFSKGQLNAVYYQERMGYEIDCISRAFSESNIEFIHLKGTVIRKLYPEPFMRTSCDIDVLVKREQLDKAIEVLTEQLQYNKKTATFHDITFSSPSGVTVELHFELIEDSFNSKAAAELKNVWDLAIPVAKGSSEKLMPNELFMLYHISHMGKHILNGGCGIRTFIDLQLLRKNMPFDINGFDKLLKRTELLTFKNAAYALCDVWFSEAEHTDLTERLERFIVSGGVYGSAKNSFAVAKGENIKQRSYIFKTAFLPRENLECLYPNLKKHRWLLPFYQVKRWFKFFDKSKRKNILDTANAEKAVSSQEANSAQLLMQDLKLK